MQAYKNFWIVTLKSALIVAVLSLMGLLFRGLAEGYADGFALALYVAIYALGIGAVLGGAGYWAVFLCRKAAPQLGQKISLAVGVILAGAALFLARPFFQLGSELQILCFPIMPAVVGVGIFNFLCKKHIFTQG